jgi:hypothetical protein
MDAEHPIPQQVSSYQFKLVGDMTIQQFFQIAGGALVSLIIYSSTLPGYVKWPLIIASFLIGVAFAFFPIEDRPLSKWLILFIKAIYSPTIYVWNKNAVRHEYFAPEEDNLSTSASAPAPTTTDTTNSAPLLQSQPTPNSADMTDGKVITERLVAEVDDQAKNLEEKEREFVVMVNKQFSSADTKDDKTNVEIPTTQTIRIDKQSEQAKFPINRDVFSAKSSVGGEISPSLGQKLSPAQTATYASDVVLPSPPTSPNIIVGQVLDEEGRIIDGAILEIKDTSGRSVRALKTNRVGHFMIITPLTDGLYQIVCEREGFSFDPVSVKLEGKVLPPIVITGKSIKTTKNTI